MKHLAILAIIYCTLVSAIPLSELTLGVDICPQLNVKCVKDGDWKHPVGDLGKKRESESDYAHAAAFCREGIRCNQCDISKNSESPVTTLLIPSSPMQSAIRQGVRGVMRGIWTHPVLVGMHTSSLVQRHHDLMDIWQFAEIRSAQFARLPQDQLVLRAEPDQSSLPDPSMHRLASPTPYAPFVPCIEAPHHTQGEVSTLIMSFRGFRLDPGKSNMRHEMNTCAGA